MFEKLKKYINADSSVKEEDSTVATASHYLTLEELPQYAQSFSLAVRYRLRKGHKYRQETVTLSTLNDDFGDYNRAIVQYIDDEAIWEVSTSRLVPIKILSFKGLSQDERVGIANTTARYTLNHQK